MWKLIEKPKVLSATNALAMSHRDMLPAPGDRPLKNFRVEVLKKHVANGTLRICEWATVYCKETRKTYRVNGKHTSTLMCELNGEIKSLAVLLQRYECDTLDEVARLYSTFDTRSSARTTGDINCIFAATVSSYDALPKKIVDVAVTGISLGIWGLDGSKDHSPEDRAALLLSNEQFVLWLNDVCHSPDQSEGNPRLLRRAPVVMAMFRTWEKDKKAANDFWTLVKNASGPKHTTPDRKLNSYLLQVSLNGSSTVASGGASRRQVYVKCIHAWNAWRRGATTDLKYLPNAQEPKVV